jgi:protein gp37
MSETTKIEWTHIPGYQGGTWNPWQGCTKVSPGCVNCYMFRSMKWHGKDPAIVRRSSPATFNLPTKTRTPTAWFLGSLMDFFHPSSDPWRFDALLNIAANPQHRFLILTKRPGRIKECMPDKNWGAWNRIWMGVTCENQKAADERIPLLLPIPVRVHFVSVEPMLERIDFHGNLENVSWVICGGESGPGCRPMNPDWAREVRDQCKEAGVAFFMKQLGGHPNKRNTFEDIPEDLRIREFPRWSGRIDI